MRSESLAYEGEVGPGPEFRPVPGPLLLHPQLDSLTGGFAAGKVAFIDSASDLIFPLTSLLCFRAALEGEVVFVDGGNSIEPYGIARLCKSARIDAREVLSRIRVARAFTAYQLSALINDRLEFEVRTSGARTVIVSCLLGMFFDREMPWAASHSLVRRCLGEVRTVARDYGCFAVVTNRSRREMSRRLAMEVARMVDVPLSLRDAAGALLASSVYGSAAFHVGGRSPQRTMDQFGGGLFHGAHPAHL